MTIVMTEVDGMMVGVTDIEAGQEVQIGDTGTAIRGCTGIDQEIVETRIHTVQAVETGPGIGEDHAKEML